MTIPGVGPVTASAIVATIQDAGAFASGREFAAFLGLTPRQNSSGGKDAARAHHKDGRPLGGFKWSSQHLDGSCDEHSKTALGSFWAGALVLTRSTAGGRARGAAAILGSDCGGHGE